VRIRSIALTLFVAVALVGSSAAAYVLPVRHVVRKVNARLNGVHSLQVALVGRARSGDAPDATVAVAERWVFQRATRGARVDVNGPGGRTASWSRGGSASGDAALLPSMPERVVFGRLFGDGDIEALARDLGVDMQRQRLGLIGDRPAIVLGSAAPGDEGAQIWIDRDDYHVVRVRWRDVDRRPVDLELGSWQGPPTRGLFPQRVRVVIGGRWARVMEADDLRSKAGG
jgi:hypothetical protein